MSATSARAAHNRRLQSTEPTAHRGASAFDVERTHVPFKADIAQLAHVVRRLLDSGHSSSGEAQSRLAEAPVPHLHFM